MAIRRIASRDVRFVTLNTEVAHYAIMLGGEDIGEVIWSDTYSCWIARETGTRGEHAYKGPTRSAATKKLIASGGHL